MCITQDWSIVQQVKEHTHAICALGAWEGHGSAYDVTLLIFKEIFFHLHFFLLFNSICYMTPYFCNDRTRINNRLHVATVLLALWLFLTRVQKLELFSAVRNWTRGSWLISDSGQYLTYCLSEIKLLI